MGDDLEKMQDSFELEALKSKILQLEAELARLKALQETGEE